MDKASWRQKWKKISLLNQILVFLGIFSVIATIVIGVFSDYGILPFIINSEYYQRYRALNYLSTRPWQPPDPLPLAYVHRKEEEKLKKLRRDLSDGKYYIIIGSMGSGKSTLVNSAFSGEPGVIYVEWSIDIKKGDIIKSILEAIGYNVKRNKVEVSPLTILRKLLSTVNMIDENEDKLFPVIIIDIQRQINNNELESLAISLRSISSKKIGRCFLIVNEVTDILELSPDPDGREYIWIHDIAHEDACEYLDKGGFREKVFKELTTYEKNNLQINNADIFKLTREERDSFDKHYRNVKLNCIENLGTKPSCLYLLAKSENKTEDFIKDRVQEAYTILSRFKVDNILEWSIYFDILSTLCEKKKK